LGNFEPVPANYPITFLPLNRILNLQSQRHNGVVLVVFGQVFQDDAQVEGVDLGMAGKVGDDGLVSLYAKGF
jgi:hypothetical protein